MSAFFDADWTNKANLPFAVERMPKGFFLTHRMLLIISFLHIRNMNVLKVYLFSSLVLSSLEEPLSSQSLREQWPKVAERLGFPISSLSDDDFE